MADVFISYKRQDRALIEMMSGVLTDLGLKVWFDASLDVGEAWAARLEREALTARAVLVCWTPEAARSQWVLREAEIGLERGVLAPAFLAPCVLPERFAHLHACDLSRWNGEDLKHKGFLSLLTSLGKLTNKPNIARNARLRAGGKDEELVVLLRALLVARARSGAAPYGYKEAEMAVRIAAREQRMRLVGFHQQTLWGALDAIADQNRARREPPLSALVVNNGRGGLPGRGYFQKHVGLSGETDPLAAATHARHLERVREFDWTQDA